MSTPAGATAGTAAGAVAETVAGVFDGTAAGKVARAATGDVARKVAGGVAGISAGASAGGVAGAAAGGIVGGVAGTANKVVAPSLGLVPFMGNPLFFGFAPGGYGRFPGFVAAPSTSFAAQTVGPGLGPQMMPHVQAPQPFTGVDFKRWQEKMLFYLTAIGFAMFVLHDGPITP
ncbi:uncharacterized protein LOC127255161 [Andrographis paniculata]|uniref:uncharacterized protein LOC127255161 n=1 Tax=Andrographis paniculata TaxID=175694 RepID=UPI0021E9633E|nr:uncharacterized protein LOC127255161 [Andrographis paniculata]